MFNLDLDSEMVGSGNLSTMYREPQAYLLINWDVFINLNPTKEVKRVDPNITKSGNGQVGGSKCNELV